MPLSGHEKAAVFLSALGEDTAAEVLKGLDVKDIGRITMYMTRLTTVSRDTIDNVLKDVSESVNRGDVRMGGTEFVKKVLAKGLGEDGALKMMELASKEGPLEALRWVDAKTLVN